MHQTTLRSITAFALLSIFIGTANATAPSSIIITSSDSGIVQKKEQKIAVCIPIIGCIPDIVPAVINQVIEQSKPSVDLNGIWIGDNYGCGATRPETVNIEVNGNSLVATKIDNGDEKCVLTNSLSFSGSIPNKVTEGSSFPVTGVFGTVNNPSSTTQPGTLTIIDANTLRWNSNNLNVTFNRKPSQCLAETINQSKTNIKILSNVKTSAYTQSTVADSNASSHVAISEKEGKRIANKAKEVANDYNGRQNGTGVIYESGGDASKGGLTSDCSHFVHDVLKQAGINVPYVTAQELKKYPEIYIGNSPYFIEIPKNEARAGDVMVQNATRGSHMGIYTGTSDEYGNPQGWQMGKNGADLGSWGTGNKTWFPGGDLKYYRPAPLKSPQ